MEGKNSVVPDWRFCSFEWVSGGKFEFMFAINFCWHPKNYWASYIMGTAWVVCVLGYCFSSYRQFGLRAVE